MATSVKVIMKGDALDKSVREITARQTAERDAKTARLRKLRLAKEAETASAAIVVAPVKKRSKKA